MSDFWIVTIGMQLSFGMGILTGYMLCKIQSKRSKNLGG